MRQVVSLRFFWWLSIAIVRFNGGVGMCGWFSDNPFRFCSVNCSRLGVFCKRYHFNSGFRFQEPNLRYEQIGEDEHRIENSYAKIYAFW